MLTTIPHPNTLVHSPGMIILCRGYLDRPAMAQYIFFSTEGYTFTPNSEGEEPDVENCQVLGFSEGRSADEAFRALIEDNEWIAEGGYEEVIGMEVRGGKEWFSVG